jgi:hypothetical protein
MLSSDEIISSVGVQPEEWEESENDEEVDILQCNVKKIIK